MQMLASAACKCWHQQHANVGTSSMQMLASAACKCWHQQHANVGISSMQMLPNNGYVDGVRIYGWCEVDCQQQQQQHTRLPYWIYGVCVELDWQQISTRG
jgi:hypothetical protein